MFVHKLSESAAGSVHNLVILGQTTDGRWQQQDTTGADVTSTHTWR